MATAMPLIWENKMCTSHLEPTCQLTMPSVIARTFRERCSKNWLLVWFVSREGLETPCYFEKKKKSGGGWRAPKESWKNFMQKVPVKEGDIVRFEVTHYDWFQIKIKVETYIVV